MMKPKAEMKANKTRLEFIRMRAAGCSYRKIAEKLHIGKSTCAAWNKELEAEIQEQKREELKELYETYAMNKAARIRRLGDTLKRIEDALSKTDLEELPPERLLDYALKYAAALKEEHTEEVPQAEENTPLHLINALRHLLDRVRSGEVSYTQTKSESVALLALLKACDVSKNTLEDMQAEKYQRVAEEQMQDFLEKMEKAEAFLRKECPRK